MNANLLWNKVELPAWLEAFTSAPEMQRLQKIGMNCGCEYSAFPLFRLPGRYTRYIHSLGVGWITWEFSHDKAASAAALLHDIASPVFAHTVDFLNGDYEQQESTEASTEKMIASSAAISALLRKEDLSVEDVADYHRYPIADNDSPRLSADRLEYTLGNLVNFRLGTPEKAQELFADLTVTENEEGTPELAFRHLAKAEEFAFFALECGKIYVSPEDRYSMQRLSELLALALQKKILVPEDLYSTEERVIEKLLSCGETKTVWQDFRTMNSMARPGEPMREARIIPAKKRRIDPLVAGEGRVSALSGRFTGALQEYLDWDFTIPIGLADK